MAARSPSGIGSGRNRRIARVVASPSSRPTSAPAATQLVVLLQRLRMALGPAPHQPADASLLHLVLELAEQLLRVVLRPPPLHLLEPLPHLLERLAELVELVVELLAGSVQIVGHGRATYRRRP